MNVVGVLNFVFCIFLKLVLVYQYQVIIVVILNLKIFNCQLNEVNFNFEFIFNNLVRKFILVINRVIFEGYIRIKEVYIVLG